MIRADPGGIGDRVVATFLQIGERLRCTNADGVLSAATVDPDDVSLIVFNEFVSQLAIVEFLGAFDVTLSLFTCSQRIICLLLIKGLLRHEVNTVYHDGITFRAGCDGAAA